MFYCFNFNANFFKVLIETNENISNELDFSEVYHSVNYTASTGEVKGVHVNFAGNSR